MCLEVGIESEGQEDCMSGFLSSAGGKNKKTFSSRTQRISLGGKSTSTPL